MKHVGKMKNNAAKVVVVYRTLPGDPHSCLVVGTQGLGDSYHDTLMTLIESDSGQQANELADILATRRFPDGSVMLGFLHQNGHLVKVKTHLVSMTPDTQTNIGLDELNQIIAKQKGVSIEDLAVNDGSLQKKKPAKKEVVADAPTETFELTPVELREMADVHFKKAEELRSKADALEKSSTPKKKAIKPKSKTVVSA